MKLNASDRQVAGLASVAFALIAMVLAFGALAVAAQSESKVRSANKRIDKITASGAIGNTAQIDLTEFSITVHPGLVQAGKVTLEVKNAGSIIHELVIVRGASAAALPKVKTAGERSVGAIDEEKIAESDTMGETGDVPVGKTVTKTFDLTAGTYVVFCNIDNKSGGKVLNHFVRGMAATLVVV